MGGVVGQWLALHSPKRIKALILANTAARIGSPAAWEDRMAQVSESGVAGIADLLIGRFFSIGFAQDRPDRIANAKEMILRVSSAGYISCCAAIRDADHRSVVGRISAPTLILCGDVDVSTTVAEGEYLHGSIRNSQIARLEAAHLSNIERPTDFNNLVTTFLN